MSPHQDNSGDQVDESFVLGGPHEAQLTKEELVDQIQDSELNDSGPNEQLRRHIENFSQYGPLLRSLGHTILGGAILPLLIGYVAYQFNSVSDLGGSLGALARAMRLLCLPLFVGICLGRALRTNGIAEKYFRWRQRFAKDCFKRSMLSFGSGCHCVFSTLRWKHSMIASGTVRLVGSCSSSPWLPPPMGSGELHANWESGCMSQMIILCVGKAPILWTCWFGSCQFYRCGWRLCRPLDTISPLSK